jgi:hypothetical protein
MADFVVTAQAHVPGAMEAIEDLNEWVTVDPHDALAPISVDCDGWLTLEAAIEIRDALNKAVYKVLEVRTSSGEAGE